ncbi:amino acid permease [Spiroplasma tabanidicola]|uniref:APC family permease n=1 Tax=Spiroplasma tabanidicola TaxID=324079 RepID=A0A6I6CD71_9MOLU|nr:amino acid permease [Spiroplasma tabanidicola]QGS51924.1 APC family permease [Spiroplasma tabanidicola]
MSERAKTLTKLSIIFMSFAIIFGFRNIINNQVQFGLLACVLFLVGGAIYAIPMVLLTSEFGSVHRLKDQEAGLGSFCAFALGKKGGFLASWASYFGNLFFFATMAPFTVIALSFFFYGKNGFDELAVVLSAKLSDATATRLSTCTLALFAILLFWAGTYVSSKGPKWIGKITNVGGTASLCLGVLFILIAMFYALPVNGVEKTFGLGSFNSLNDKDQFNGDWWSFISMFPWLIFAYNGIETISVFIKDTKGGAKAFKIGSTIGMIVVMILMVVGTLMLSMTISQADINKWGISNSYFMVYPKILGIAEGTTWHKIIIHIVGFITALNGMGSLFFWTAAPAKVFLSEVPHNTMGKYLSKTDKNGIPINALWIQAIVVSFILILVGATTSGVVTEENGIKTVTSSSDFLTRITQATTSLATVQMLFYFWGYIKFRWKNDDEPRDTKFFKNKIPAIIITSFALFLVIVAFFFGVIPSPVLWKKDWVDAMITFILVFGGFIFFMGIGLLVWYLQVTRKGIQEDGSIIERSSIIDAKNSKKLENKEIKMQKTQKKN